MPPRAANSNDEGFAFHEYVAIVPGEEASIAPTFLVTS